jgi:hypothetical protein
MTNFTNVLDGAFEMPNVTRQVDEHTEETVEYLLIYAAVDVAADKLDDDLFEMNMDYHQGGLSVTFYMRGFPPDDSEGVPDGVVLRIEEPDTSQHSRVEWLRKQVQGYLTPTTEILTVHVSVPVIQAMIAEMESLRPLVSKTAEDFNITPVEAIWEMAKEGVAGRLAETITNKLQ